MNLQTFKAATMAECLGQVKASMGHDAVILHTRTYTTRYWLGLRRREIVEITAGRGLNVGGPRASRRAAPASGRVADGTRTALATVAAPRQLVGAAAYGAGVSGAATTTTTATAAAAPAATGRDFLGTAAAGNVAVLSLSKEMGDLKSVVKSLVDEVRQTQAPSVPEHLFDHYLQLIQNQVAKELASEIMRSLEKQIRPEHAQQPEYIRERLCEQLERLLPTAGPIVRKKASGPHVVALIGPTGVGKTTTLAKLAANLKLREKHRVGLITLDTYRIAAVDQLKRYADIIGSPLKVVSGGDELKDAIAGMSDCDFILIDTAGRSPRDELKLSELRGLLDGINPDEVHLVLSTTADQASVELAVESFGRVRVDRIIFTKIDEAAHVGTVLNVIRKVGKQLSYITTGQDVPDDIEVGRGRRLAQLILGSGV